MAVHPLIKTAAASNNLGWVGFEARRQMSSSSSSPSNRLTRRRWEAVIRHAVSSSLLSHGVHLQNAAPLPKVTAHPFLSWLHNLLIVFLLHFYFIVD